MKCNGIVLYKGIEKREGGVFTNEKGQKINYDASYLIKFDEIDGTVINERKVKFPAKNMTLYNKFKDLQPYTRVNLICDVAITNSVCKIIPTDVSVEQK